MATGADAVQLGDATSKVHSRGGISSPVGADVEKVDSYTIPSNVDHNAVMEDLINQGELAVRRQSLYQELSGFPDLTSSSEDDNEAPES
ncbi:hypothetical protein LINPERHAP2_LOCUS41433 [Linum perenne]